MTDAFGETAERLFRGHVSKDVLQSAGRGGFPTGLWSAVTEAGFLAALLPEESGGFGATPQEAMSLVQISASHAAPIPLAETMLAAWLLARAGLAVPVGPLTLAPVRSGDRFTLRRTSGSWHLTGAATRIPWGRDAAGVVVVAEGPELAPLLAFIPAGGFAVTCRDQNLAGEPRDSIAVDAPLNAACVAASPVTWAELHAAGAALRTVQIAGALSRALALSVEYAQTRIQFGRPIGKFQAVQQNLAILAGQAAAGLAAGSVAADALCGGLSALMIGAAKSRAGEAASQAAALAHQVHGAIGFTQEYFLHPITRRLWSWRDEFGNEAEWNARLGRAALIAGPDALWPSLTAA